jgi:hypothetical protein
MSNDARREGRASLAPTLLRLPDEKAARRKADALMAATKPIAVIAEKVRAA